MEQNRKRYSSLAKAIVIGLQMIAAVMASVSIVLFSTCVNQNMLNMGDLQNSSFVESGYFERTFSKQMMQLSDYLNLKEQFETDGVYDENRPETVNASQEQISDYKIYNNKYDQNNTNVYYWLGNLKDGTYVTNMRDVKKQEDAYEKAVNYGRYLSYNNKTFRFETNIGGIENNYYQNMAQYNELQKGDFTLIVAVDVNFPQEDDLAVAKREFDKLFPWAQRSLVLAAAGIVVWLVGLCYMTVAAAKRSEDKEIHLTNFDKLRTEIPIALLFVFSVALAALGMRVHHQDYGVMGRMVIVGTFTVLGNCAFMGMYLSLVRRVKADTFFENSYLNWLIVNLKDTLHNRYLGNRMTLIIWGVILSNVAVGYLAFHCGFVWAYILLIIFLLFTLIYFSQRVIQRRKILEGIDQITQGKFDYKLNLVEYQGDEYQLAEGINHISEGLANAIGEIYPQLNKSLLYAGIMLHDLAKVLELTGPEQTEYTVRGNLIGHIALIDEEITKVLQELKIDDQKEEVIVLRHVILSHHGLLEYGSPVRPKIMEAEIIHMIDNLDAEMMMMTTALGLIGPGEMTNKIFAMENRSFYKPNLD